MKKGLAFSAYARFPENHTEGTFPEYTGGAFIDYDVSLDIEYSTREAKFSASNRTRAVDNGISGVKLTLEEGELIPEHQNGLLGYRKDTETVGSGESATTRTHIRITGTAGPHVGFMWAEDGEDDDGAYVETHLVYKASFGMTSRSAKTSSEDGVEWGTYKLTANAMGVKANADMVTSYEDCVRFRDTAAKSAEQQAVEYIKEVMGIDS